MQEFQPRINSRVRVGQSYHICWNGVRSTPISWWFSKGISLKMPGWIIVILKRDRFLGDSSVKLIFTIKFTVIRCFGVFFFNDSVH